MQNLRLSPSALNIFLDCPKCFWLEKNRSIKRPRGIFPSLPGGMDSVIKTYFDTYRTKDAMPPEVKGKLQGKLFSSMSKLEKWRSWLQTELSYEDKTINAALSGALDDCLEDDGFYIPLDYKTRGSELIEDPRKYYQTQLDCYCLILDASGFKTKGLAYLLYYWPLEVFEEGMMRFKVEPIRIETNIDSAKKIFRDAVACLKGEMPQATAHCEYCSFIASRKG
ncbi:MAG: hypothetical protein A2Y00_06040 [Omnitrophica WOR_2 bacterium GWF2_43_52]|nr:MAG: hypothetical protein A2Y00_06040 [Omnitrophica WOR_2 bacterium GWF2_43_52]OGX58141.1 MAG: hypothetical protein A2460_05505 [Omnitrophica WOR_2 bacterium RIFOXYC2_FULL_43_9]